MIPPSFLPLQVAIYFNGWYLWLLYLAELALIIYKGKHAYSEHVCKGSVLSTYVAIATKPCHLVYGLYTILVFIADLVLPYPTRNLAAEIILLFVMALLDAIRLFLGE